jgi:hypothetical protein
MSEHGDIFGVHAEAGDYEPIPVEFNYISQFKSLTAPSFETFEKLPIVSFRLPRSMLFRAKRGIFSTARDKLREKS